MRNLELSKRKKISKLLIFALCASLGLSGCGKKKKNVEEPTEEVLIEDTTEEPTVEITEEEEPTEDTTEEKEDKKDKDKDKKENEITPSSSKPSTSKKKKTNSTSSSSSNTTTNTGSNSSTTSTPTPAPVVPTPTPVTPAPAPVTPVDQKFVLDDSYSLVFEDNFEGNALNTSNWNYETHDPGWVNSELQAYVASDDNVYVSDGKLVIQPIKTVNADGSVSYTSGRINSQSKHTFKYGYFECRAKVPTGDGYLPAFWMMPQDENLYGQWPKCGEIDIMEVMGQQTNKVYGTIHYGDPHSESQGTKIISGDFSSEYHTFSCEWEPGSIKWYVDGILYHEEHDWYSTTKGVGTVAYPAPFDQPFYIIFNVAVGGSWVGDISANTPFDESAQLVVDYVKVYQKDSYDENVKKPEKTVVLRNPDANGNYVNNGTFAAEDLTDDENWKFMTANGGDATATIENNMIKIVTKNAGTVDYSVQLVQAGIPLKKGATYEVSFDAKAGANRRMGVAVKAPDRGYSEYMGQSADLTTNWKTYTYSFKMTEDDDANGRLEFNMGAAGSTAEIDIRNVKLVMTKDADPSKEDEKTVLANGSLVYNGEFQEGENRLAYWEISDASAVSVTNENNNRELVAKVNHTAAKPLVVSQSGLAFTDGLKYELSFKASGNANLKVKVAGEEQSISLTDKEQTYTIKIPAKTFTDKDLSFVMTGNGTITLDSVKVVEDSLIKNGSFNAGLAGFELYTYTGGMASIVVDSLSEENAADITINNTGDTDWYIQLKQSNISLEEGQWYNLSFKVKSNLARKIMYAIQRDGTNDNDYTPYTGSQIVSLSGNGEYQTVSLDFKMTKPSDAKAILSITMGAVDGVQISKQHRICIDDIKLTPIAPKEIVAKVPVGTEMTGDVNVNGNAAGTVNKVTTSNGAYIYDIASTGSNEWDVQLADKPLTLIKGSTYRITFKANSTIDRNIKVAFRDENQNWQGHYDVVALKANEDKTYTVDYKWNLESTETADFGIFMGTLENETAKGAHKVTISDLSIKEIIPEEPKPPVSEAYVNITPVSVDAGMLTGLNKEFNSPGAGIMTKQDDVYTFDITNVGTEDWQIKLAQSGLELEKGADYKLTFNMKSSIARPAKISLALGAPSYSGYYETINLNANEVYEYSKTFTYDAAATKDGGNFAISLAKIKDDATFPTDAHKVQITGISLVKVKDGVPYEEPTPNPEYVDITPVAADLGMLTGVDKSVNSPAVASMTYANNVYTYDISDEGTADWNIKLAKTGITLEKDAQYKLTMTVKSSVDRNIKVIVADSSYTWETGKFIDCTLTANTEYPIDETFTFTGEDIADGLFNVSLGAIENDTKLPYGAHKLQITGLSLTKVEEGQGSSGNNYVDITPVSVNPGLLTGLNKEFNANGTGDMTLANDVYTFDITSAGTADWNVKLANYGLTLEQGETYKLTMQVKSSVDRKIKIAVTDAGDAGMYLDKTLTANTVLPIEETFVFDKDASNWTGKFAISLGAISGDSSYGAHKVQITGLSLTKVETTPAIVNLVQNALFAQQDANGIPTVWECDRLDGGAANVSVDNGTLVYDITDASDNRYKVRLRQRGINMEQGHTYRITFNIESSIARNFMIVPIASNGDNVGIWTGWQQVVTDNGNGGYSASISYDFTWAGATDSGAGFEIQLGAENTDNALAAHVVKIKNVSLIDVTGQ